MDRSDADAHGIDAGDYDVSDLSCLDFGHAGSGGGATSGARTTVGAAQKPALQRIGDSASSPFLDSQPELGARYQYVVRSVVMYEGKPLESSDSNVTGVTARDMFPPSTPEGLIVTLIPAQAASGNFPASPAYLELSWAIAPEHDVAGYNVYRSECSGEAGKRQNADLLPTPAFRDMNVAPGKTYYYTVTAVDRARNESAPSAAAQGSANEQRNAVTMTGTSKANPRFLRCRNQPQLPCARCSRRCPRARD